MKYIVYWILTTLVSAPCPSSVPVPDKFGRVSGSNVTCAALHFEQHKESLSREFNNIDSAKAFYASAITESRNKPMFSTIGTSEISGVRLDSIQ